MERRNLKLLRVSRGLTQAQAAERIGVSRSNYIGVERGTAGASKRFAAKLQKAFGIPDEEMWTLLKTLDETENNE